ncbi:hypothetical protein [Hyphomicrobium sp.]|uniref:hypothetical protein n=1 Tax=Hyphomicrobium sp. TaxID=82 RepID=UPI003F6FCD1A
MASTGGDAQVVQGLPVHPARQVTLGWFLRRSLLGIAILLVAMGGLAWLTYASIDPTLDAEAASAPANADVAAPAKPLPVGL